MVLAGALASAQGKMMQAKPMMRMKMAPMKPMSKAQWQGMYNQAEMLFDKKDADGIFRYMAPDFSMTMMGQKMNTEQAKASMKQWFGMMKDLHAKMTVTSVMSKANMAMVTDSFHMSGHMMNPKTKKWSKYVDSGMETATWVRMGGKWMMKSLTMKGEKMTMDGKPFDPSKMGG